MDRIRYLFIDGAYAREAYQKAMEAVFGVAGEIAPERIVEQVESFRTFYYDCMDETRKPSETEAEFNERVAAQEKYFSRIRALRGVHLQLGTLTGPKRRQKEVDVLLAVDMLTHGFNRNMTHAVLVSGDLDFRPVVEALVRAGVFVEVWYEKNTAAKELYWAADLGQPLDWHTIYNWSEPAFCSAHTPPRLNWAHEPVTGVLVRSGTYEGRPVQLLKPPNTAAFTLRVERADGVLWAEHEDQQVLERYFSTVYGAIDWSG